jgi:hypothetical protein
MDKNYPKTRQVELKYDWVSERQAAKMNPKTGLKMIHLHIPQRLPIFPCICGASG